MRRLVYLSIVFAAVLSSASTQKKWPAPPPVLVKPGMKYIATAQTGMGNFYIELYADDVPKTVSNFIFLAREGFFDGQIFHRVVEGHVIQSGCPLGTGYGDSGYTIPYEESHNKHVEGAVGMARYEDLNSASSQWYVTLAPKPNLDEKKYVVFGRVYEGMDVVHKIGKVKTAPNEIPIEPVYVYRVIITEIPK